MKAAFRGDLDILSLLLDYRTDVNAVDFVRSELTKPILFLLYLTDSLMFCLHSEVRLH